MAESKALNPRTLEALLRILRAAGVTSYQAGDVKIEFAIAIGPHAPVAAGPDDEPELPDGLIDPLKAIEKAHRKYREAQRPSRGDS